MWGKIAVQDWLVEDTLDERMCTVFLITR